MYKVLVALLLVSFLAAPCPGGEPPKTVLDVKGTLSKDDRLDAKLKESFHKVHEVKLEAGKSYRIDLTSPDFDTFLRLESADGKEPHPEGCGYPHARKIGDHLPT